MDFQTTSTSQALRRALYLGPLDADLLNRTPTFETWTQTSYRSGLEMVLKRSVTSLSHSLQWSVTGL